MTLDPRDADPFRAEGTDDDYELTTAPFVRHLIAFLLGALVALGLVVVFGVRGV